MTADFFVCCIADVAVLGTVAVKVGIAIHYLQKKIIIVYNYSIQGKFGEH